MTFAVETIQAQDLRHHLRLHRRDRSLLRLNISLGNFAGIVPGNPYRQANK